VQCSLSLPVVSNLLVLLNPRTHKPAMMAREHGYCVWHLIMNTGVAVCVSVAASQKVLTGHRERKCADTTDTVPVPWPGHFPC